MSGPQRDLGRSDIAASPSQLEREGRPVESDQRPSRRKRLLDARLLISGSSTEAGAVRPLPRGLPRRGGRRARSGRVLSGADPRTLRVALRAARASHAEHVIIEYLALPEEDAAHIAAVGDFWLDDLRTAAFPLGRIDRRGGRLAEQGLAPRLRAHRARCVTGQGADQSPSPCRCRLHG
jgi:hypothetical protein